MYKPPTTTCSINTKKVKLNFLVLEIGLEPITYGLEDRYSIHLSYTSVYYKNTHDLQLSSHIKKVKLYHIIKNAPKKLKIHDRNAQIYISIF